MTHPQTSASCLAGTIRDALPPARQQQFIDKLQFELKGNATPGRVIPSFLYWILTERTAPTAYSHFRPFTEAVIASCAEWMNSGNVAPVNTKLDHALYREYMFYSSHWPVDPVDPSYRFYLAYLVYRAHQSPAINEVYAPYLADNFYRETVMKSPELASEQLLTSIQKTTERQIVLELGCGQKKRQGAIGVDSNPRVNPDVAHDLNVFPYPFAQSSVDGIVLDNVLEHLNDVIGVMEELYRILKLGGTVKVIVPYFRSNWAAVDPTHRHLFAVESFAYFDPRHEVYRRYRYSTAQLQLERLVFNETLETRWPTRLVARLASRRPWLYEYYFSHLYPLDDITFYLRKV